MEKGLGFLLHPFTMEVLTEYNIIVFEFYPNDWGCIVGFIMNCMAIGIESTLTAFSTYLDLGNVQ